MGLSNADYLKIIQKPGMRKRNPPNHPIPDAEPKPNARHVAVGSDAGKEKDTRRHKVVIELRVCRILDKDNAYGAAKWPCDALRYLGLIRDDNPDAIDLDVRQVRVKTLKEEMTVITVEEL